MASTAPLQPENYGVRVTRVKEVLQLSKANQSLGEVCFILKTSLESCVFLDESKCIYPGTEISVDLDDDVVVVTYGRGLCSEPDDMKDQPGQKVPPNNRGTSHLIIAIGVIASIGVIIVISLGLMYFYGLMCCTKRKKANRNATQHGDNKEGEGTYTELIKDMPSHSSGPGTSYYMDLKPTNPTSTADATAQDPGDHDFNTPETVQATRHGKGDHHYDTPEGSNDVYMDTDMNDAPVLQERADDDYVSPTSPKGSECHYANADGMVSGSESGDHQYLNHAPSGEDGDETTAHIYLDMKPM